MVPNVQEWINPTRWWFDRFLGHIGAAWRVLVRPSPDTMAKSSSERRAWIQEIFRLAWVRNYCGWIESCWQGGEAALARHFTDTYLDLEGEGIRDYCHPALRLPSIARSVCIAITMSHLAQLAFLVDIVLSSHACMHTLTECCPVQQLQTKQLRTHVPQPAKPARTVHEESRGRIHRSYFRTKALHCGRLEIAQLQAVAQLPPLSSSRTCINISPRRCLSRAFARPRSSFRCVVLAMYEMSVLTHSEDRNAPMISNVSISKGEARRPNSQILILFN